MDTIWIKSLVFMGKHGVYDEEHEAPQRFGVDIEVTQQARDWQEKINNTYDYMVAREIARKVIEEKSFRLIETIAETISREILLNSAIQSVSITISKLDVLPPAVCGVTITRTQSN